MDEDMRNFPWCADLADGNPWFEITVGEGYRIAGIRLGTRAGGSSWVSQFNISMKETSSSPLVAADVLVKGLEMPFTGLSAKTKQGEPATYFTASYKDGDFFVSSGYTYATTVRFTPVKLGASDGSNDIDVGGQTYTCARIGLRVCHHYHHDNENYDSVHDDVRDNVDNHHHHEHHHDNSHHVRGWADLQLRPRRVRAVR